MKSQNNSATSCSTGNLSNSNNSCITTNQNNEELSGRQSSITINSSNGSTTGGHNQLETGNWSKLQALKQRKCELEKLLTEKTQQLHQIQKQEALILNGNGYSFETAKNVEEIISSTSGSKSNVNSNSNNNNNSTGNSNTLRKKFGTSFKLSKKLLNTKENHNSTITAGTAVAPSITSKNVEKLSPNEKSNQQNLSPEQQQITFSANTSYRKAINDGNMALKKTARRSHTTTEYEIAQHKLLAINHNISLIKKRQILVNGSMGSSSSSLQSSTSMGPCGGLSNSIMNTINSNSMGNLPTSTSSSSSSSAAAAAVATGSNLKQSQQQLLSSPISIVTGGDPSAYIHHHSSCSSSVGNINSGIRNDNKMISSSSNNIINMDNNNIKFSNQNYLAICERRNSIKSTGGSIINSKSVAYPDEWNFYKKSLNRNINENYPDDINCISCDKMNINYLMNNYYGLQQGQHQHHNISKLTHHQKKFQQQQQQEENQPQQQQIEVEIFDNNNLNKKKSIDRLEQQYHQQTSGGSVYKTIPLQTSNNLNNNKNNNNDDHHIQSNENYYIAIAVKATSPSLSSDSKLQISPGSRQKSYRQLSGNYEETHFGPEAATAAAISLLIKAQQQQEIVVTKDDDGPSLLNYSSVIVSENNANNNNLQEFTSNSGLGGYWKNLPNNERIWCAFENGYENRNIQRQQLEIFQQQKKDRSHFISQRKSSTSSLGNSDGIPIKDELLHKASISSMNSDANKKSREKQWLETSLDAPLSRDKTIMESSTSLPSIVAATTSSSYSTALPTFIYTYNSNNSNVESNSGPGNHVLNNVSPTLSGTYNSGHTLHNHNHHHHHYHHHHSQIYPQKRNSYRENRSKLSSQSMSVHNSYRPMIIKLEDQNHFSHSTSVLNNEGNNNCDQQKLQYNVGISSHNNNNNNNSNITASTNEHNLGLSLTVPDLSYFNKSHYHHISQSHLQEQQSQHSPKRDQCNQQFIQQNLLIENQIRNKQQHMNLNPSTTAVTAPVGIMLSPPVSKPSTPQSSSPPPPPIPPPPVLSCLINKIPSSVISNVNSSSKSKLDGGGGGLAAGIVDFIPRNNCLNNVTKSPSDIRIESPKNMTVIQQATFLPYKEVTKPFEMSDFYKYSTKFRQKESTGTVSNNSSSGLVRSSNPPSSAAVAGVASSMISNSISSQ